MIVLCSADVHGDYRIYEWLLTQARLAAVDAIVLAGDLLGCPDGFPTPEAAQRYDASHLTTLLDTAGLPVFFVMGNDDLVELDPAPLNMQSLHGRRLQYGATPLVGYQ